jgi:AraC-like DNA-binding protein
MTAITDDEARALLRTAIAEAGTLREWAEQHGISPSYVSEVLTGKQAPGVKLQRALGLIRRVVYARESHEDEGA